MFLIGLTGGIAAGKSTVAKLWVEHGAIEIDADQLAREVVLPGTEGSKKIRQVFGAEVCDTNGDLDRKALAAVIFHDSAKRTLLEQIIHPEVRRRAKEILSTLPQDSIVIYNVPLLVEAEVVMPFDKVITVEAPQEEQVARLIKHRGMTESEALSRIRVQASPARRAARADVILSSNHDLDALLKHADNLWHEIVREATAKKSS
jgi:dephospho-CoA kinase